jgi:hypothetical protein
MKIAIFTALYGNRNTLSDPTVVHDNVDYVAFVDRQHPQCKVWKQVIGPKFTCDNNYQHRRNAKIYKILPNLYSSEYDYYFWVDATHDVVANPFDICKEYLSDNDIALFKHTTRNCTYDEAIEVKRLQLDDSNLIDFQLAFYKRGGMPSGYGLFELPVMVRKNTQRILDLNLKWWEQICKFSSRDQLSFMYCLWKLGIEPTVLPGFANGINPNTGKIGNNNLIPQTRNHRR